MKKKTFAFVALCLAVLMVLTACGSKTAITAETFQSKATDNGLTPVDITDQYTDYDYISSVTVAQSSDGWQVEFYVFDTADNASKAYQSNVSTFESEGASSHSTVSTGNYSYYEGDGDSNYQYVCYVDNTMIYAHPDKQYKDAVKDFIKVLDY